MSDPREPINLFVPSYRVEECLAEIRECLEGGWTGLGFKTLQFEKMWKAYSGVQNAHMTNSATAALHLALRVLKQTGQWEDGDEVITTPLTFVSTNHAILYERLTPVFADVDETLCMDLTDAFMKVTSKTRAILFVGMGGNVGKMSDIRTYCRAKGLKFILDAAHMAGTYLWADHVGRPDDAACFSFHSVKNLPTADAGMVCFQNPALDALARRLSWLGIDKDTYTRTAERKKYAWKYEVPETGFKYHGNSVMAAMGIAQLRHLEEDNIIRRELAMRYDEVLKDGGAFYKRVPITDGCTPSRHLYQVLAEHRDELVDHLNSKNIFPGVHYIPNTEYPMYHRFGPTPPNAAMYSGKILSLPLHLRMTTAHVDRVASEIRSFYGKPL